MIRAGIAGAAGYTGGELIRLLTRHPEVTLGWVSSRSQAGLSVGEIHRDLWDETDLVFSAGGTDPVDVLFLCGGHGQAAALLQEHPLDTGTKVIDLSQDFRLQSRCMAAGRQFVYGLPEFRKKEIKSAEAIANPGCFATAVLLSLLPVAASGAALQVHSTGITGSTGAGQELQPTTHFSWRADNVSAYKALTHQHLDEVGETLYDASGGTQQPDIRFIPWRGPFTRGIFVSSVLDIPGGPAFWTERYRDWYADHPLTTVSDRPIDLKQVVNTSRCLLHVEGNEEQLVVHAAIDNLLKGAAGQAVQNMNLVFGLDERTGLDLKPAAF